MDSDPAPKATDSLATARASGAISASASLSTGSWLTTARPAATAETIATLSTLSGLPRRSLRLTQTRPSATATSKTKSPYNPYRSPVTKFTTSVRSPTSVATGYSKTRANSSIEAPTEPRFSTHGMRFRRRPARSAAFRLDMPVHLHRKHRALRPWPPATPPCPLGPRPAQ